MPNANSSAIVVCSPSNHAQKECINEIVTSRTSINRDNTPERGVLKLLNSNSSQHSATKNNNSKSKHKSNSNKGLAQKKMKLRNLINNNLYNGKKGGKMPKFEQIGMSLLNGKRKKSHLNSSKHQNSEYVDIHSNLSCLQNKENINSTNLNSSKANNMHGKAKKSLSRIKSNYFNQNLGTGGKNNLRKTSSRKRRNVNSSATLKNKTKNITSTVYYTHRDKEMSKRGMSNSKILTEITENRSNKADQVSNIAKKNCESTKVSHRSHLKNSNIECGNR